MTAGVYAITVTLTKYHSPCVCTACGNQRDGCWHVRFGTVTLWLCLDCLKSLGHLIELELKDRK